MGCRGLARFLSLVRLKPEGSARAAGDCTKADFTNHHGLAMAAKHAPRKLRFNLSLDAVAAQEPRRCQPSFIIYPGLHMTASTTSKFTPSRTLSGLLLAGLLTATGGAVMAQTPPPGPAGMRAPEATRDAPHADGKMGQRDPAKMQAMMAKRAADMKAKLKITPAQEPAWTAFTASMKPPAGGMGWGMSPEQRAEMDKLTTPERIDKMRAQRTQRMAEMNTLADQRGEATKVFYAQLSAEQKAVFDAEHKKRGMHHEGRHGGMHKG